MIKSKIIMFSKFFVSFSVLFLGSCSVQSTNKLNLGSMPALHELIPQSDYVIYSDCATLPTLYSAINMFTHNKESYIYMGRANTLDLSKLPSYVHSVSSVAAMRSKVAELNAKNPSATFTLYVNDARVAKVFSYFYSQGIGANRVKVVMLSDGTGTYKEFADYYSSQLQAYSTFQAKLDIYRRELAKNPAPNLDKDFFFSYSGNRAVFLTAPIAAENTVLWMQWPNLFVSDSKDLENYLLENTKRYYKVEPLAYYKNLSIEKQQQFLKLVGLDKVWANGEGNGTLQNQTIGQALSASSKPNIIITGTNPYNPSGANTDSYIAKVKAKYGNGYDYFFKGHPADTTTPSDKSIVVLPFRLPMEAILFAYGDQISVIGGYESSLYMNAPQETQKFFFNEKSDGSTLVTPLNLMYRESLLGNVTFF